MSIEMEDPKTVMEKVDAAANLVEQMHMAHRLGDETRFKYAHQRAGHLLLEAMEALEGLDSIAKDNYDQ